MKRLLYILGITLCFALLGAWAGSLSHSETGGWTLGGAALGAWLGVACAGRAPARRS